LHLSFFLAQSRGRPSSVKQLRTLRFFELRVLMAHYHRQLVNDPIIGAF
jgi:hypothetical protein